MKKFIIAMIILSTCIFIFFYAGRNKAANTSSDNLYRVKHQTIISDVLTTGTVTLRDEANVIPAVAGTITKMSVNEGDKVYKGEVLAQLDTQDIDCQIEEAQMKIDAEKLKYDMLLDYKNNIDYTKQYQAFLNSWNVYDNLQDRISRIQSLADEKKAGNTQLNSLYDKLNTAYDNYLTQDDMLNQLVNSYKNSIEQEAKQIDLLKLNLKTLDLQKQKYTLKSPINGIIIDKMSEEYDVASQGKALFTIGDLNNLKIEADVNQYDIDKVKTGQEVRISRQGINGLKYQGVVSKISPSLTVKQNGQSSDHLAHIVIDIENADANLKPGFTLDVSIITGEARDVLAVPIEAVKQKDGNEYVYLKEGGKYLMKNVSTGLKDDFYVQIKSGLSFNNYILLSASQDNNEKNILSLSR